MDTIKTMIFGLSSSRRVEKYIICLYSDKKFSLGLEPVYPILQHLKKNFFGCYGDVQDQDIRTQLIFWSNWYIIYLYSEKKNFR